MTEKSVKTTADEHETLSPEEEAMKLKTENEMLKSQLKAQEESSGIPLDMYIEVMSLVPYKLNLSTERQGKGRLFSFSRFGEVKRILYNDLASILENYHSFMEQGYFYIMNAKVIRKHGLDDIYEKVLTKDKIESILSFDQKNAVKFYESATKIQRETVDSMLIEKLKNGTAGVDLNIVAEISRIGGTDIINAAKDKKEAEVAMQQEQ